MNVAGIPERLNFTLYRKWYFNTLQSRPLMVIQSTTLPKTA
jgi:hypothetical protein